MFVIGGKTLANAEINGMPQWLNRCERDYVKYMYLHFHHTTKTGKGVFLFTLLSEEMIEELCLEYNIPYVPWKQTGWGECRKGLQRVLHHSMISLVLE